MLSTGNWFLLTGLGLYMGYVPCNGLYFERLVASFRYVSTVGFIVTLADYYGYMGSVAVLLYKNFGQSSISYLVFFINGAYILAALYSGLVIASFLYFRKRYQTELVRPETQSDQMTSPTLLS
jgi:hypothetical protein